MRLFRLSRAAALMSVGLAFNWGCAETVDDIDRTKPNALPKKLFEGEWYFTRTTIDSPYENDGTFTGDRQEYMFGEDFPAWKIRWRIEEDKLLACRADDVTEGDSQSAGHVNIATGEGLVEGEEDLTQEKYGERADMGIAKFPCKYPIAAFKIDSHFDIGRDYNAATGEQSNVISENTTDRPWYEREYIRVNWADLSATDINFNIFSQSKSLGWFGIENVYFVQEETGDCRVINDDGSVDYSKCEEGFLPPIIDDDNILLTNRMTIVPDGGVWTCYVHSIMGYGMPCTLAEIGMRYSFKKVPNLPAEQQYEPLYYPDEMFERFGAWRVGKDKYLKGYGLTDLINYKASRFNIWEKSFQNCQASEEACSSDEFNCFVEVDKNDGHHIYKRCEPIPVDERTPKPIDYYLNREFPSDLKPIAFQIAQEWSNAYAGINDKVKEDSCHYQCKNKKSGEVKLDKDCTIAESQPGSEWEWSMAPFDGEYCMFNLHENDGQKFMGDLRYNFIAHIEDNGLGQPCGVGGPANDPDTGELVNATAYIYGNCFDYYEQSVFDRLDVLCAQKIAEGEVAADLPICQHAMDENVFMRGYNFLDIVANQGRVKPPVTPIYSVASGDHDYDGPAFSEMREKLEDVKRNARAMQNNHALFEHRAAKLAAAGIDRLMIDDVLAREISGGAAKTAAELTDEQVAIISPLNRGNSLQSQMDALIDERAAKAIEPAEYIFTDDAIWAYVQWLMNERPDLTREELGQICREESFRATALHELGHNQGMRHNFRGTFDRAHFPKEYWDAKNAALEKFKESHGGRAPVSEVKLLNGVEDLQTYTQWAEDRDELHRLELKENIGLFKYSTIMDYHGLMHGDWNGLGSYDKAFMRFLYANKVDAPACDYTTTSLEECAASGKLFNPDYEQYYLGGDSCSSDEDCPHFADGQKCRDDGTGLKKMMCTNWFEDRHGKLNPYIYQFCSDERVSDDPFCNRFDVGETAEEIIRSMIDSYNQSFIFNKFRRYRKGFSARGYVNRIFGRHFSLIGDMMQSLLYKYIYEEGFRIKQGPGNLHDMMRAVVLGFNFLGNIIMKPESGTFTKNNVRGMYTHSDDAWDGAEANNEEHFGIPLGQGEPAYSSYENGYFGEINRLAFIGSYYDKLLALETLTNRYWGSSELANENRFNLNFFDFFPSSFVRLVGGLIANDTKDIANRFNIAEGRVEQRNYFDGYGLMATTDENFAAQLDNDAEGVPVEAGAEFYSNLYAILFGALDVAYYANTSFADIMRVFELGSGDGFDLSRVPADKVATCTLPRSHRTFAAVDYELSESVHGVGYRAVKYCDDMVSKYETLVKDCADETLTAGYTSIDAVCDDARSANGELKTIENSLSNLAYICDVVGIGRL